MLERVRHTAVFCKMVVQSVFCSFLLFIHLLFNSYNEKEDQVSGTFLHTMKFLRENYLHSIGIFVHLYFCKRLK